MPGLTQTDLLSSLREQGGILDGVETVVKGRAWPGVTHGVHTPGEVTAGPLWAK